MNKKLLTKMMVLLCALIAGNESVWADETSIALASSAVVFDPSFGSEGTTYASTAFSLTSTASTTYSGWTRKDVACGGTKISVKKSGNFTSPNVTSTMGYSVRITYTFSSDASASVSIKIGSDNAVSSTSAGTLTATTTSTSASFKISAGSTRAVYITKLEIIPKDTSNPSDPTATVPNTFIAQINSDGTCTCSPSSSVITTSGSVNTTAKYGFSNGLKFESSSGIVTISLPENAINATVTLLSSASATSLKLDGTSTTVSFTGDTSNGYTTTINIPDSYAAGIYTIAKGSGSPIIYKITLTYDLPSDTKITLTTTSNMDGWRTFYDATQDYEVDANTKIYVAATSGTTGYVTLSEVAATEIPHGEAVILKTSAGDHKMVLTKTTGAATLGANVLTVTDGTNNVDGYRLGYKATPGVAFFKYTTTTAPAAGIVYIDKNDVNTGAGAPEFLAFNFGSETTAIKTVNAEKASVAPRKMLKDGRIVIETAEGTFLMNGSRVK